MRATGILVKVRGNAEAFGAAAATAFGASGTTVEPILSVPSDASRPGVADSPPMTWFRIGPSSSDNPWDRAHAMVSTRSALGAAAGEQIVAAEPDFMQHWPTDARDATAGAALAAAATAPGTFQDQDPSGSKAVGPRLGWSTGDEYSQLAAAARLVTASRQAGIVIAHLDTGYDPAHPTNPPNLDLARQRNFVAGQPVGDATDVAQPGLLTNPGHGPATLAILAGGQTAVPEWSAYQDPIGGTPFATVVPVRIADGVVQFTTGTMVQGFAYATQIGAHVLTMSMGGLSSDALVDAVNAALTPACSWSQRQETTMRGGQIPAPSCSLLAIGACWPRAVSWPMVAPIGGSIRGRCRAAMVHRARWTRRWAATRRISPGRNAATP